MSIILRHRVSDSILLMHESVSLLSDPISDPICIFPLNNVLRHIWTLRSVIMQMTFSAFKSLAS